MADKSIDDKNDEEEVILPLEQLKMIKIFR